MMEAVRISETMVCFCDTTQRNIAEGYHLLTIHMFSNKLWFVQLDWAEIAGIRSLGRTQLMKKYSLLVIEPRS
jgi:hypothetical protein